MRKIFCLLAVGCLLFLLSPQSVFALNDPRFWLNAKSKQSVLTYAGKFSDRGACHGEMAQTVSGMEALCSTQTSWGKISEAGIALSSVNLGTYRPLILGANQYVLRSPDSRRLYVGESMASDSMRIGYIDDVSENISLDPNGSYVISNGVQIEYLNTVYRNIAFAGNSHFVIGSTPNGTLVRTSLTDFSTKSIVAENPSIQPEDIAKWAISNEGNVVAGLGTQNAAIVYDLDHCREGLFLPDVCKTKQASDPVTMITPAEFFTIEDGGDTLSIYSQPFGADVTRITVWIDYDSLNRYVTYAALGDSFSSGEGGWWYDNNTDGTDEFVNEKCHQSNSAYPQQYAWKYLRFSDEYYEPNLGGEMVIRPNSYTLATCSGARTEHIQSFDTKFNTNSDLQRAYSGQFDQSEKFEDTEKKAFTEYAVDNKIPGRALQIEFLKKYKPTIATIGIGGNDVGFGEVLKSCIAFPGTCAAASTNKHLQGKKIQDEFWLLSALFSELHKASPDTRLYAVGYPRFIADDDYQCGANVLLDAYEREFVKQATTYLNEVIKAAAKKNGLIYIDFESAIGSAGLCGDGTWGVNGLALGNDKGLTINGKQVYVIANESYHPSPIGQFMMADRLIDQYGALDIYPNPNCPGVESGYCRHESVKPPAIPNYFGDWFPSAHVVFKQQLETARYWLPLSLDQFKPGAIIKLKVFSQETVLGEYQADTTGKLETNIVLPSYLEPGYHTLYASGTDADNNELIYEQVFLYLPDDTQLGPCGFLPYANLDQDGDGIDDACDPEISVENPLAFADPTSILTYPNPVRVRPITDSSDGPKLPSSTIAQISNTVLGQNTLVTNNPADLFATPSSPIIQKTTPDLHSDITKSLQKTPSNKPANATSQNPAPFIAAGAFLLVLSALFVTRKNLLR